MRWFRLVVWIGGLMVVGGCGVHVASRGADRPLVTGKWISPRADSSQDVGSMPINLIQSPDGRYVISTDVGYYQSLWVTRTSDGKGVSHIEFSNDVPATNPTTRAAARTMTTAPASRPAGPHAGGEGGTPPPAEGSARSNGLYYGLAITRDGRTVYASQGAHDTIAVLSLDRDGKLTLRDRIRTRHQDFPAGLALDDRGRLYVANNAAGDDDPYKLTASAAVYDPNSKKELGRYTFSASHGGTSNFPLGIAALRDGSKVYVAAERDDAVYVLDTRDPSKITLAATLATGAHPVAVLLSRDQKRLFVANSQSDTISVVDTGRDQIISTILLRPKMARELGGVTPTSLALSPDEKTVYAALGDMNAVAVIDPARGELRGYVPTSWYPSAVAAASDGWRLLVANAKGSDVRNPNNRPDRHDPKKKTGTSLTVMEGNVCAVRVPTGGKLAEATREVIRDNRLDVLAKPQANPLASIGLAAGKITHVLYVIKENRTYDQVLGDLPEGNGDKSLVLFGRNITPNHHALAERFVLMDDLYACGEVSGDGWDWSTQGMANAYVIRNIPYNYSHRGRKFDEEGQNNGYPTAGAPATDENGKPWAHPSFKKVTPPIPDVGNTGRNIWDAAKEANVSLRNYGFFLSFADRIAGVIGGPDNLPASPGLMPGGHDLAGVTDLDFRRFDLEYPDSDLPERLFKETGDRRYRYPTTRYGKYAASNRFAEWNREFQMMLAKDPRGGAVPNLMLIRLPNNHTSGAKPGKHSPKPCVADNDYALGQIVESVSHSAIWKSTAIFVIEDDAQAGVDHVDCHRTCGFVISPWIKPHAVDHHFYNTDSMLKTMELLLGLKPLCQYDAVADPILDWADGPINDETYTAIEPAKALFADINPQVAELPRGDLRIRMAQRSEQMDFTHADAAPAQALNEIVWQTIKGSGSRMPAPRGWATGQDDDDD